jgi:4-hydroxybenzoate polyprenyltransferase
LSDAEFMALPPVRMAELVRAGVAVQQRPLERAKLFLMLGRPRTWVPNLLAFGLGYSYTGGAPDRRMLLGALLSCCIGFSANTHNAAVELAEDSENLPGRVLMVAKLGYRRLFLCWRVLVALMMITALYLGLYFSIFMALAIVGLHQYSAPPVRSKGRPVLGLWVFAQAVVFPFLFGWTSQPGQMLELLIAATSAALQGTAGPPAALVQPSLRYLTMWAFLTVWFMAKGSFKNVPDYQGDKAAGVRTSATVFASQQRAALATTVATVLAYGLLLVPVALGLEHARVLWALVWLVPVFLNCVRLVRSADGGAANQVLKQDMWLSTGFLATLLVLVDPTARGFGFMIAAAIVLFGSDALAIDSRRPSDVRARAASSQPITS